MPMMIALNGYGKSGKDYLGKWLVERKGFVRYAFADVMKEVLYRLDPMVGPSTSIREWVDLLGWDEAKSDPRVRGLLQRMGTEAGREGPLGADVWVRALEKRITEDTEWGLDMDPAKEPPSIVITDCRFRNEAEWVKNLASSGNSTLARIYGPSSWVVRIYRPGVGPVNDHKSEIGLDQWDFDYIFNNDKNGQGPLTISANRMLMELANRRGILDHKTSKGYL